MNDNNHYTTIYNTTKADSDKALPIQKQILSDYLKLPSNGLIITDATPYQDTKQCTDILIVNPVNNKSVRVGVRKRNYKPDYPPSYLDDISIRSSLTSRDGQPITTEIHKLANSGARLMMYTWFDGTKPIKTYIINIDKLIPHLPTPYCTTDNHDGSRGNYYKAVVNGVKQPWVITIINN